MSASRLRAEHRCPIHEGEDPLSPPDWKDARLEPWVGLLNTLGVLEGYVVKVQNATMMRGVGGGEYLFRIEWDQPQPLE